MLSSFELNPSVKPKAGEIRGPERAQKACPKNQKVEEVIEVARLQGRILAIIGKPENLSRVGIEVFEIIVIEVLTQDAECEHSGGRRTAFPRQTGQPVNISTMRLTSGAITPPRVGA